MYTTTIQVELNKEDLPIFESLFKKFKAKMKIIKEEKDDTKMTKEAYFAKIDRARKSSSREVSQQEIKDIFGV